MLRGHQREMQDALQRRVLHGPDDGPGGGLDETEHSETAVQKDIAVALIQMKSDTLKRVQEALVRLDLGEYGYCCECDGEIAEKRLQALPFAVRCTACEAAHEQRGAQERRCDSRQRVAWIGTDLIRL